MQVNPGRWFSHIQKFDLLVGLYIFCLLVAEVMGSKTFPLGSVGGFPLMASVAIFVIPLLFSVNDIVTEVFGPERTRSIVATGWVVLVLLIGFSLLATSLPPSRRFQTQEAAYDTIFLASARISAASLTAFLIAHLLDIAVFTKVRQRLGKKSLWLRNNVSNIVAQFFDTTIFMTLAFYALDRSPADNAVFLTGLIVPYWLLKSGMSVIETPLVYWGVRWLKKP